MNACPTPRKIAFHTQATAINVALTSSAKWAKGVTVYQCPCGRWHTTSKGRA